jgi:hypothetical protein
MSEPGNTTRDADSRSTILDPYGRSLGLKIEDDGVQFVVHPRWLPSWFIITTQSLPWVALNAAALCYVLREGAHPIWLVIAVLCTGFGGAYHALALGYMEWGVIRQGEFARLDRRARHLHLSRIGIDLDEEDVLGFVVVSATIVERDDEGSSYERLFELSVLVKDDPNESLRFPVVTCMHRAAITRVACVLADYFHVDLQFLKAPRTQEVPQKVE